MSESSTHSNLSNQHLLFAETLRDWRDPLLHGHEPLPVLLCPRCITCKCESLKDLHHTSSYSHHSSCPNFRHSIRKQQIMTKSKRRANSYDPSISILNTSSSSSSIITSKSAEYSPLINNSLKQQKSTSKIPVRISAIQSDYSPSSSSINLNKTSKIPHLILRRSLPSPIDDLYETDR